MKRMSTVKIRSCLQDLLRGEGAAMLKAACDGDGSAGPMLADWLEEGCHRIPHERVQRDIAAAAAYFRLAHLLGVFEGIRRLPSLKTEAGLYWSVAVQKAYSRRGVLRATELRADPEGYRDGGLWYPTGREEAGDIIGRVMPPTQLSPSAYFQACTRKRHVTLLLRRGLEGLPVPSDIGSAVHFFRINLFAQVVKRRLGNLLPKEESGEVADGQE